MVTDYDWYQYKLQTVITATARAHTHYIPYDVILQSIELAK